MSWRAAFLAQAKHEYSIYRRLNDQEAPLSDQLHYLQMATEKLARGYLADPADIAPPPMTHAGIIRMMQILKADRTMRRKLGFAHLRSYRMYLDSLADTASRIQALAPAIAGTMHPNPEYPWLDRAINAIQTPCQFAFPEWNDLRFPHASKFLKLLNRLMVVLDA